MLTSDSWFSESPELLKFTNIRRHQQNSSEAGSAKEIGILLTSLLNVPNEEGI